MAPDPRLARTRAKVLDAAWLLLNEVGFDAITVEMVSERSGVARSTLYRHWRSIPELLRDAFAAQAGVPPAKDEAGGAGGALRAYARAVAVGLTDHWGRAAMSMAASAAVDPEQRALQQVFVRGTWRDLRAIVVRAQAAGELDGDADEAVDRLVDQVIAPQFYRFQFTDTPTTPEQAERLADRAWAALVAPSGRRA